MPKEYSETLFLGKGDIAVTTNGVTTLTPRVHPSDLDVDGLPDGLDPNPTVWDGDFFGPRNVLPEGANSNAYCYVDLVVHGADAEVVFSGDGPSNLADPHFMARAEETNRVAILIGKGYEISADEPIECVGVSDASIDVYQTSENTLYVRWPVSIECVDTENPPLRSPGLLRGGSSGGISRTMHVVPDWLGGEFSWETNHCCEISMSGFAFAWACLGDCGCGGCQAHGWYVYEGYVLDVFGGECGCSPAPHEPEEPEPGPSVFVSFSQKVLFYEDGYTNSIGVGVEPYCATNVVLNCVAYGGQYGGLLQLTLNDGGRLDRIGGDELPVGAVAVAANETRSFSVTYESIMHSDSEDDITATATFTETLSGETATSHDSMTVVSIRSVAVAIWPSNRSRRNLGVGELAFLYLEPNVDVECSASRGFATNTLLSVKYTAPSDGGTDIVTFNVNDVLYDFEYHIVEPTGFATQVASTNIYAQIGQSGGFATRFRCRLLPLYVSFKNVEVMELPMISTDAVGYYAQEGKAGLLDHGAHGAGTWDAVDYINRTHDTAGVEVNDPPWLSGGSFTWPIPVVWRVAGSVSDTNNLCSTDQRFELDADGTSRVRKFGYVSERMTNGVFTVTRE